MKADITTAIGILLLIALYNAWNIYLAYRAHQVAKKHMPLIRRLIRLCQVAAHRDIQGVEQAIEMRAVRKAVSRMYADANRRGVATTDICFSMHSYPEDSGYKWIAAREGLVLETKHGGVLFPR